MTVSIKAPDRGAYENFERSIKIDDSNKYIRFSATRMEKNGDRYLLANGEFYRAVILKIKGDWYIRPPSNEEDADNFDVKISKEDAKKILNEFDVNV